jgi:hypothetical protein
MKPIKNCKIVSKKGVWRGIKKCNREDEYDQSILDTCMKELH